MCAIFGSTHKDTFSIMYQKGCERGDFAHSFAYIYDEDVRIIKGAGKVVSLPPEKFDKFCAYRLGHTQAPTSSIREFNPNTSHPFRVGNWIVAHNGVLENDRELIKKYWLHDITNEVDSSVIPALIYFYTSNIGKQVDQSWSIKKCILEALNELKGTYAIWAYDTENNNVYLARSGSLLYCSGSNFSSNPILPEYELLEEGSLYRLHNNGYTGYYRNIGKFKTNSQFFV